MNKAKRIFLILGLAVVLILWFLYKMIKDIYENLDLSHLRKMKINC